MNFFAKDHRDIRFSYFFWFGLLLIMLLRSFYFGITYFHFLDDYNTYGIFYRRNANIFHDIILYYRHFTWRPIAFFADAYITQWFWPNMWVVLLFYTLMHFATVFLFWRVMVLSKINFGLFGIIIISLTPILAEAVYWIGASTRLVAGMFFSILSAYFLLRHIILDHWGSSAKKSLILYIVFNIISNGFFEQVIAFNLVFTLIIIILNRSRIFSYAKAIVLTPILGAVFISIYYAVMAPHGRVGERAQLVSLYYIFPHFFRTTAAVGNLLIRTNYEISANGLLRGMNIMMTSVWGVSVLVLLILFSLLVFFIYLRTYLAFEDEREERFFMRLVIGILLAAAAFGPFYLLEPQSIPPRTVYPAIFGIAIFMDTILSMLATIRPIKIVRPIISVLFILPFFIIYIAEVNNYRLLEEVDKVVVNNFLQAFEESGYSDQKTIVLFNTQYTIADVTGGGNPHRLENVTSSNWAMLGIANATSRDFYFRDIQPIQHNRNLPGVWANHGLFGLDEDLNIFRLELRGNALYLQGTNIRFGRLDPYDTQHFTFVRGVD